MPVKDDAVRPAIRAEGPLERIAFALNLAPVPAAEGLFLPAVARSVMAGVRLGIFGSLARRPAGADQLAQELGLAPEGTRLLLNALVAVGHVRSDGPRYSLTRQARRWLDPSSDLYIGDYVLDTIEYWGWWDRLEDVVRTGNSVELHERAPDDPYWRVYIRGQYQLARVSAPEVARALRLPRQSRALLDVAGGHGWFSAALCRRYPTLTATVLDLPGSAAVGREIIAEAGMSDRVRHVEGDLATSDFGGPYDAALCFNIIHHLTPEQNVALLRKAGAALAPGGTLAVLDLFTKPGPPKGDAGDYLGLFFYMTSAAATYSPDELRSWLEQAGFERPRRVKIRRIPVQTLYASRKRP